MPQNELKRAYTFSDAELKQKADGLVISIVRDIEFFAARNFNKDKLVPLEQMIAAFDATSTDKEMEGWMKVATEQKDAVAEELRPLLRTFRNIANSAFGGKGNYHVFSFGSISQLSDDELCRLAKRVYRIATRLKADMEKEGLTQAQLDTLAQLYRDLDKAIDNCGASVENRDIETQDRIKKGNAVYAEIMRLADIGKGLFEDTDEARYNDYVLVGAHSSPDKPNNGNNPA